MESLFRKELNRITKNQLKGNLSWLDKYSKGRYRLKIYLQGAILTKKMIKDIKKISPDISNVFHHSGTGFRDWSSILIYMNCRPSEIKIVEKRTK